ncbi:glycoside hydrolase family protein [Actinocorallia lasiicapitis]
MGITAALMAASVFATACSGDPEDVTFTPTPDATAVEPSGDTPKQQPGPKVVALPAAEDMPAPAIQPKGTGGGAGDKKKPGGKKNDGDGSNTPSVPRTGNCLKGVGMWDITKKALTDSGSCWYYSWSTDDWYGAPAGTEFVPMIWGRRDLGKIGQAKGGNLLGFNEPDLGGEANLSPEEALDLWPQLVATGKRLGSPAPSWGGDRPGGWLDRFMQGAKQRGLRVDFVALHYYEDTFGDGTNVAELKQYLTNVHNRYGKPIWLTEFALMNLVGGQKYPEQWQQANFAKAATKMLEGLPFVERYAWFALPTSRGNQTGLFNDDGSPTAPGRAFMQAARTR